MNLFSMVSFVQSKYRPSLFDENLASKLGCSVNVKYPMFRTILKKDENYLINNSHTDYIIKMTIFWIHWLK